MIGSSAREISCSRSYEKGRPRDEDACSAPKKTRGRRGKSKWLQIEPLRPTEPSMERARPGISRICIYVYAFLESCSLVQG